MTVRELLERFPHSGRLEWIGLASERRAPMRSVEAVEVELGTGLVGEHHSRSGRGTRQVTLVQQEHLEAVGSILKRPVRPEDVRRNLVVSGINLLALKKGTFRIGEALLEGTGPCEPCSRMEENLATGGYNAMRGHGGICARVLRAGRIRVGDSVQAQLGSEDTGARLDEGREA